MTPIELARQHRIVCHRNESRCEQCIIASDLIAATEALETSQARERELSTILGADNHETLVHAAEYAVRRADGWRQNSRRYGGMR